MAEKSYWFVTRPHRKLIRVPKSLSAFASVATGETWTGNRPLQIQFETQLESLGLKQAGNHTERDRGQGGSGGRTHAQLLYALGLYFMYQENEDGAEEVHLTLAGQALVDQENALPLLRKQVLAFQYPSAYSVASAVDISRKFKLRPFVLLLKLLRNDELQGYISDLEIAACVIGYATSHSDLMVKKIVKRILEFRARGIESLDDDFSTLLWPRGTKNAEQLINTTLHDIANTFAQWLQYTGFTTRVSGADLGLEDSKLVTVINDELISEIDSILVEWSKRPLIPLEEHPNSEKHKSTRSFAAFQRTYGVKFGATKDQRQIGHIRRVSSNDRLHGAVSAALTHLYSTEILTKSSTGVVDAIVNQTGLDSRSVIVTLDNLIPTPQRGMTQFLDRYQQLAFSGTESAIDFEKATANILRDVFSLNAEHIGQSGRVPDVVTWSEAWTGIVDTKAYAAYQLESDHQLRMQTSYIPAYQCERDTPTLEFFLYIAGGFANSFNVNLKKVMSATGVRGSGIGMRAWLDLINVYPNSGKNHEALKMIFQLGREITPQDVVDHFILSRAE